MNNTATTSENAIFNKSFLGRLRRVLDQKCQNGATMTRDQVCEDLGIPTEHYAPTISALIKNGQVEGYEIRKGPWGGIGKVGEKRAPGTMTRGTRASKADRFDPKFLEMVQDTLDEMTEENPDAYVRRIDVARKMGLPGSDTENAISLAIRSGKIKGYESKRGAGHGIRRVQATASPPEQVEEPEAEEVVEEEAAAPTPEARPTIFTPVSKKSKKQQAKAEGATQAVTKKQKKVA